MKDRNHSSHAEASLPSYCAGFFLSILLTIIPYLLVVHRPASGQTLFFAVIAAALLQLVVQLRCFLHLDFSPKSRANLLYLVFTGIMVFIIVFGSLWIMHDLNYFMMDPIMNPTHAGE